MFFRELLSTETDRQKDTETDRKRPRHREKDMKKGPTFKLVGILAHLMGCVITLMMDLIFQLLV